MDLTTTYLGLTLPHPLVCGASPLTSSMDMVLRLEDAGAAAIVMHSLFEEQLAGNALRGHRPHGRPPFPTDADAVRNGYALSPDRYLEHLLRVKERVDVPIIASLNGTTPEGSKAARQSRDARRATASTAPAMSPFSGPGASTRCQWPTRSRERPRGRPPVAAREYPRPGCSA
jgi:dihydroorotate dehydrogenase